MYIFQQLKKKMSHENWKTNLLADKKFVHLYVKKNSVEVLAKNINKQIR
ncbi:MAG: hypothetical protein ABF649_21330 [Bacillus sp. (in: firmicutes)]